MAVGATAKAPREELVRFWSLQRLLDEYCFGRGCGGWEGCPIWCEDGAAFMIELAHLCPHEAVRRAMRAISEMSRGKSAIYYSLTGEEYEEVMREVERRLRAELKAEAVVG